MPEKYISLGEAADYLNMSEDYVLGLATCRDLFEGESVLIRDPDSGRPMIHAEWITKNLPLSLTKQREFLHELRERSEAIRAIENTDLVFNMTMRDLADQIEREALHLEERDLLDVEMRGYENADNYRSYSRRVYERAKDIAAMALAIMQEIDGPVREDIQKMEAEDA